MGRFVLIRQNMSVYVNYQSASQSYDQTRIPVGIEIVRGVLTGLEQPLEALSLLDAGCGTGNYTQALMALGCQVNAVDLNEGMLSVAQEKLADHVAAGRLRFQQASIESLPFEDAQFDAIVVNQVLHHLEDESPAGFPRHRTVFGEFARVLRPGGVLLINTCSREQVRRGYWYTELIPEVVERLAKKYIEGKALNELLHECGLEPQERYVPLDVTLQGAAYFQPERILEQAWRDGDSTFALMDEQEVAQMEGRVRGMIDEGAFEAYFAHADRHRTSVGQSQFVVAKRAN